LHNADDKDKPATEAAPAVTAPAPATYRARVDAVPASAHLELDGKTVRVGRIDEQLAVNIKGVINGIKAFVPGMKAHGQGGHIGDEARDPRQRRESVPGG
jgi:NADP-dependent 3-hydroxy acid dehydrogenase YdfG